MWLKGLRQSYWFSRFLSTQLNLDVLQQSFRASEHNPLNHGADYAGQFYTLENKKCKTLFSQGGLPKMFTTQTKTFTETCLMIREPALEIIEHIQNTDMSKPVNRVVLYGEKGSGKSLTLAHVVHYASEAGFLLVHVPWVSDWLRRVPKDKEMSNSATRDGWVDLPVDSASWLLHFKTQNNALLKKLDLRVTKEYVWSKRETTALGSPILELIDLGINRIKYASDIIVALTEEIKMLSTQNLCKTFVAVDGFNAFFYQTRLRTNSKRAVQPNEVPNTYALLELTKNNWCNGFVVVTVDQMAVYGIRQDSYFPRYLLGKKGFEHLDPFIPIEVKNYSEKEFISCLAYYTDRLWLRASPEVESELGFVSGRNPYNLMKICAPL